MENDFNIGNIVISIDEELPLRSSYHCYRTAVVVSLDPFVLVSPDSTMRWNDFPKAALEFEEQASPKVLRFCSLRFKNDNDYKDYARSIDYDGEPEVVEPYEIDASVQTIGEMFDSIKPRMDEDEFGTWKPKAEWLIMIREYSIDCMHVSLGTLFITCNHGDTLHLQLNSTLNDTLKIYSLLYTTI